MRSPKVNTFYLVAILSVLALASAHGEEKKEEAKEDSGKVIAPLPKEQKEFYEKTSRLNSLSTRIEEDERQFADMINRKAAEKNPDEKQRILKQMVEVTNDRNKSAEEYNKIKSDLSLRYPNQGEHLNRRYQTQGKKSMEELEGVAGLDELLTRTKKIVEKKFAPFNTEEDMKKPKPKTIVPEEEKRESLRLEK